MLDYDHVATFSGASAASSRSGGRLVKARPPCVWAILLCAFPLTNMLAPGASPTGFPAYACCMRNLMHPSACTQGALVMPLMARGFQMGLVKFNLITASKP